MLGTSTYSLIMTAITMIKPLVNAVSGKYGENMVTKAEEKLQHLKGKLLKIINLTNKALLLNLLLVININTIQDVTQTPNTLMIILNVQSTRPTILI